MNCPFKNNQRMKQAPCSWYSPPGNSNVRICETCGQHYRVDKIIREEYEGESFLVFFAILFIAVVLSTVTMLLNSDDAETLNQNRTQVELRHPSRSHR